MNRRTLLRMMPLAAVAAVLMPDTASAKKRGKRGKRGGSGRRGRGGGMHRHTSGSTGIVKRLGDPGWYQKNFDAIRRQHEEAMRQIEENMGMGPVGLGE